MTTTPKTDRRAVLTADEVVEARRRVRAGEPVAGIARSLGVADSTLHEAVNGNKWARLNDVEAPVTRPATRPGPLTADDAVKAWRDVVERGGGLRAVARALNVNPGTLHRAIKAVPTTGPGSPFTDVEVARGDVGPVHGVPGPRGYLAHQHVGTTPCGPCTAAYEKWKRDVPGSSRYAPKIKPLTARDKENDPAGSHPAESATNRRSPQ